MSAIPLFRAVTEPDSLSTLVAAWTSFKNLENEAKLKRYAVEQRIAQLMPCEAAEGRSKADVDSMRVVVEYGVTRKVDSEKLAEVWPHLAGKAQEAFRWKAEPVLAKLRALQEYDPTAYAIVASVIETKPSKPAVTVTAMTHEAA